jgi:hypothetical protein
MIPVHLPNLKELGSSHQKRGTELLIWIATTLISGLVIIVTISPDYLRDLHPFTLLLLSVACSLPIWALNQLLWWQISRTITTELVNKLGYIFGIADEYKKGFSFALSQFLKLIDIIRFIPHEKIANLITVIAIYVSAALVIFTSSSPTTLYLIIIAISFCTWLVSLILLQRVYRKLDTQPLHDIWRQIKDDDELLGAINLHFRRLEEILLSLRSSKVKGEKTSYQQNENSTKI